MRALEVDSTREVRRCCCSWTELSTLFCKACRNQIDSSLLQKNRNRNISVWWLPFSSHVKIMGRIFFERLWKSNLLQKVQKHAHAHPYRHSCWAGQFCKFFGQTGQRNWKQSKAKKTWKDAITHLTFSRGEEGVRGLLVLSAQSCWKGSETERVRSIRYWERQTTGRETEGRGHWWRINLSLSNRQKILFWLSVSMSARLFTQAWTHTPVRKHVHKKMQWLFFLFYSLHRCCNVSLCGGLDRRDLRRLLMSRFLKSQQRAEQLWCCLRNLDTWICCDVLRHGLRYNKFCFQTGFSETKTGNVMSNHRAAVQPHCCHLEPDRAFCLMGCMYGKCIV